MYYYCITVLFVRDIHYTTELVHGHDHPTVPLSAVTRGIPNFHFITPALKITGCPIPSTDRVDNKRWKVIVQGDIEKYFVCLFNRICYFVLHFLAIPFTLFHSDCITERAEQNDLMQNCLFLPIFRWLRFGSLSPTTIEYFSLFKVLNYFCCSILPQLIPPSEMVGWSRDIHQLQKKKLQTKIPPIVRNLTAITVDETS